MRIYKPWLYPEILFSMYLKLTGHQKVFETVETFSSQVCFLDLKTLMNIFNVFSRSSLCTAIPVVHNLTNNIPTM